MSVLICGGSGYIGSHTCVELVNCGHEVIIADNFINSNINIMRNINKICNKTICFHQVNICDYIAFDSVFKSHPDIDTIMHFAALKSVAESVEQPLKYYENNLGCTINILKAMDKHHIKHLVFSSSATVYGTPEVVPIKEDSPINTLNPYGETKIFSERMISNYCTSNPNTGVAILRYFNPIGAHPTALIGEMPVDIPNNLVPYIAKVAVGEYERVNVYGNDYNTHDGTGVRDYIHIVDLARGHVAALNKLQKEAGCFTYNLGTGKGHSVLDIISVYEKVSCKRIPCVFQPRRPGDAAVVYADPSKAMRELGWVPGYSIEDMCMHSHMWELRIAGNSVFSS